MKKKMKPIIQNYYLRQLYSGRIKHKYDFMNYIERKYFLIFKINLNNYYYDLFMDLIITCI